GPIGCGKPRSGDRISPIGFPWRAARRCRRTCFLLFGKRVGNPSHCVAPFMMTPMTDPSQSRLSHFDASGQASMVDVSAKQTTRRTATASAFVELSASVLSALPANPKGNPLEIARFAGIQAAKRTADLIPMCHPLPLTHADVRVEIVTGGVCITASVA